LLLVALTACAPLAAQAGSSAIPSSLPATSIPDAKPIVASTQPVPVNLQPARPFEIHKTADIPYAEIPGSDKKLLTLDVYSTGATQGSQRVMIYVHGGGWSAGDKSVVDAKPEFFLRAGFVFVSVNYRLCPKAVWPSHVEDIAKAVSWVVKNISAYGGDPHQVYLIGHSAGGHLVTLLGTDERFLKAQGLSLSTIKAVVSIDTAAFDLSRFASQCSNKLPAPYGDAFGQDPAIWKEASPVTYIVPGKGIPPIAVIYSGDVGIGSSVPRQQIATEFTQKLAAAAIPFVLIGAPEKNHNQVNEDFGAPGDPMAQQVLAFIQKIEGGTP
jgi:acetyl esterase/lipase